VTTRGEALRHVAAPAPEALPRLLAGVRDDRRPVSLAEHLDREGSLLIGRGGGAHAELIELVTVSGLSGRGGGAFPTGQKLRAVAEGGRSPIVLVNGVEGELISSKDHVLLAQVPHLVLDGAAVAAAAIGAREVIVAVGAGLSRGYAAIETAIAEREHRRLDRVSFRLIRAPDRFVAGEETALVNFVNGGSAKPTFTPPRPYERGIRGMATLVQNVETVANLALLARFGPRWFRALGTSKEPGTALVTLGGAVRRPGVYEIPLGLPVRELVAWAGGPSAPIRAYLIGGYFGTWVAAAEADALALLDSDLRTVGASLGARAIVALPETSCGIVETARVARYLADESAGQCGPCVRGLDAIATALSQLATGTQSQPRLQRWLEHVSGRGACRHPDGAARFIASALRVFADEVARHAAGSCSGSDGPVLTVARKRRRAE
jgi:NADH:ubiquinone oxidoreductase subunit F (NADH-binding)